jgi:predicted DsbA family dithiol-disulfide isomerase
MLLIQKSFFVDNFDIGLMDNVLLLAEQSDLDRDALKALIDEGAAGASLMSDYQQAAELNIKGSPSWVMNNGRQELFGNVGYRILRANIKEVLSKPGHEASWC